MTQTTNAVTNVAPGVATTSQGGTSASSAAAAAPATNVQPTVNKAPTQTASAPTTPAPVAKQDSVVPLSALHEERNKRQELARELESLRSQVESLRQPQPSQQQQQFQQQEAPTYGVTAEEVERLWDEDPKRAVRTEIMLAMNWYDRVNSQLEAAADQLAVQRPDFNTVRGQVMNQIRSLPVEERTPQAIQHAYLMARGSNMDEIIKQREQEWQTRMGAPAGFQVPSTGVYGPGASSPSGGVQLDAQQLAVANAMGMTPEQYAAGIVVKK